MTAELTSAGLRHGREVMSFEENLSGMDFFESENGASKRCFAAARFANKTKRLAFGNGQRDVVNGFDMA